MRACDIEQGGVYRLKSSPNYGYVKVLCVLKPKQEITYMDFNGNFRTDNNENNKTIVRCVHSSDTNFDFGIIRNVTPSEIVKKGDRWAIQTK